jgi:COP9 signalosome complex subunit 2
LSYIAKQLNITDFEVEELLVELIMDEKIKGRIDQITGQLNLTKGYVLVVFSGKY